MQDVKPALKKCETYLVIALTTGLMSIVPMALGAIRNGLPPQWAAMLALAMPTLSTALIGFFAKLRHDAYAQAGIPDPTVPATPAVTTVAGAVDVLKDS